MMMMMITINEIKDILKKNKNIFGVYQFCCCCTVHLYVCVFVVCGNYIKS